MSCVSKVDAVGKGKGGTSTLPRDGSHGPPVRLLPVVPGVGDIDDEASIAHVRGLDVCRSGRELREVLGPRVGDGEASRTHVRGLDVPHTSAAALVIEGNEHGEGSHVNDAKTPSEQEGVALLAVYPVSQATVHDAESAISVTPLPHTSAAALVTDGNVQYKR